MIKAQKKKKVGLRKYLKTYIAQTSTITCDKSYISNSRMKIKNLKKRKFEVKIRGIRLGKQIKIIVLMNKCSYI